MQKHVTVDDADETVVLNFEAQRAFAAADGWLQGRYFSEEGVSVREMLSFNHVFDVSPYEVGVNRRAERRDFNARFKKVTRLLELNDLLPRPFNTLSNGEMRRALFARVILKNPKHLILDDPMAGLDPRQRARFGSIIRALEKEGIAMTLRCRHADEYPGKGEDKRQKAVPAAPKDTARKQKPKVGGALLPPIVELNHLNIQFGRRVLFRDFSWTVRQGEHWVLSGPNGSGKTTLMALITGDSPLAYANDVKVFGIPREPGYELAAIRRRIAMVSPEMQTYLDKGPEELLEEALAKKPELLILDEPCLNLDSMQARKLLRHVTTWLSRHPRVTAIVIAHRSDHIPSGFTLHKSLGTEALKV